MCEISLIDNSTMDGGTGRMNYLFSAPDAGNVSWLMAISDTLCLHTFSQCTISQAPFLNTVVRDDGEDGGGGSGGGGGGRGSKEERQRKAE